MHISAHCISLDYFFVLYVAQDSLCLLAPEHTCREKARIQLLILFAQVSLFGGICHTSHLLYIFVVSYNVTFQINGVEILIKLKDY